jgi:hypothetical protein
MSDVCSSDLNEHSMSKVVGGKSLGRSTMLLVPLGYILQARG